MQILVDWDPDFPELDINTVLPAVHSVSRTPEVPSPSPVVVLPTVSRTPEVLIPVVDERNSRSLVPAIRNPASRSPSPLPVVAARNPQYPNMSSQNLLNPTNTPQTQSQYRPRRSSGASQPEVIRPNIHDLLDRMYKTLFKDTETTMKGICKELKIDCEYQIDHNRNYGEFEVIHQAAAEGDLEKVKMSIAQGGDPNLQDPTGKTALHYAIINFHTSIAQYLIGLSIVKLNIQDYKGKAPIQ